MARDYQVCSRCIMDTTDPDIRFDEHGVCNHCKHYETRAALELFDKETAQAKLESLVERIRLDGRKSQYDCLLGVSGGVDSTMASYVLKQMGVRTLAVHLDNGWDSECAVSNIQWTLNKLGIDLYTHVIDWEEFRDLQLSFFKASVANIEVLTDHAIMALLFRTASEKKIKYVITGSNVASEAIMPESWMYDARDIKHIDAIHRRFGSVRRKTLPACSLARYFYYVFIRRIKYVPILNYIDYHKDRAKELIEAELGWRDYGAKHHESIFTRFFQSYILPRKFNIDKRLPHLSTLVCSGQITRDQALAEIAKPMYPPELLKQDYEFVLRKFKLTPEAFDRLMDLPNKTYEDYPSNSFIFARRPWVIRLVKRVVFPQEIRKISHAGHSRTYESETRSARDVEGRVDVQIYPSPFLHDSRILKITKTLADAKLFDKIYIMALWEPGLSEHQVLDETRQVVRVPCLNWHRRPDLVWKTAKILQWTWRIIRRLKRERIDCIDCHSLPVLPLCVYLKWTHSAKLVYQPHELETETAGNHGVRQIISKAAERFFIRFADEVIVVNDSIADWYRQAYTLPKVWVVKNVPYRPANMPPGSRIIREALNLEDDNLLFLYAGIIAENRGIELLLDVFARTDGKKHMLFLGFGDLVDRVKDWSRMHRNIHYYPAVSPDEVIRYVSGADVGISLIENASLSYYLCLPNKVWEYLTACLPVVVSDFPEMGRVVDQYECGWKCQTTTSALIELLDQITPEVVKSKTDQIRNARFSFGWHFEETQLLSAFRQQGFLGNGDGCGRTPQK